MMLDILLDSIMDCLKLIPFLFVAFYIIEIIEHKLQDKSEMFLKKYKKYGTLIGSILGAIPQCGFSVLATNLYITRIITLGTLFSIYLSTSDEMLPILLSHKVSFSIILELLIIKIIIGFVFGFIIDLFYRNAINSDFHICDDNDCDCEESILKSSIIHTIKIIGFVFVITFGLNIMFHYLSEEYIQKLFMSNSIFSPFLSSIVGLIPNCGASIMITELYINNIINIGTCIAGLLTGSGVALVVLIRNNRNVLENILIIMGLYFIGAVSGLIINIITNVIL